MTSRTPWGRVVVGALCACAIVVGTTVALQIRRSLPVAAHPPAVAIVLDDQAAGNTIANDVKADGVAPQEDAPESSLAKQLVGSWRLQRHGERVLSVSADGTATAEVRLNMLGALMYGERFTLHLTWTLDNDVMTQTITSGVPQETVGRLIRDWGDTRQYRVIDVSEEQLVLAEVDDPDDRQVWTIVKPGESATASETKQSLR